MPEPAATVSSGRKYRLNAKELKQRSFDRLLVKIFNELKTILFRNLVFL